MRFGILSTIALPVLLGCVDGVFAHCCKPAAKSCAASARAREAAPCTSLFIKNKVKRPTCTVVPAPVTVTKRVTPAASTKFITITHTVSTTETKSLPTVTITETRKTVEIQTSVASVTVSTTEVDTTTSIISTTTVSPTIYSFTCTNRKRDALPTVDIEFEGLVKRTVLPKCCGCFLTSTKTAARQTKTVTTTLPKATITKKITKTITATKITTAVPNTATILETTTETVITTRTDIETRTETTTETASATQTVIYDPCENPILLSGRNAFTYSGTTAVGTPVNVDTVSKCCSSCYASINCANYMFDTMTDVCTIYQITDADAVDKSCQSQLCNIGRADGWIDERPVNEMYGRGPCGGGIVR